MIGNSATVGPMFKSAGQVGEAYPIIEKFSPSLANANSISQNDLIVGKFLDISNCNIIIFRILSNRTLDEFISSVLQLQEETLNGDM